MGRSNWTPSIVPNEKDQTVYLVANDFGKPDRAWAEAEYERTDLEAVIQDPLTSQYRNPIRVVAFNTGRTLVRGRIRRHRSRASSALRLTDARYSFLSSGFHRPL